MAKKQKQEIEQLELSLDVLHPHPRNYNSHPDDQLEHIIESIREHGIYRNVVIAKENTILAGHGVVAALRKMGRTSVPVVRLPISPEDPRALKILVGDNEIQHMGMKDDRLLSELLKEVKELDIDGLLGTGFDEMMLSNLIFVTRPKSEIADKNVAASWVGMPEYDDGTDPIKLIISFKSQKDREDFCNAIGLEIRKKEQIAWQTPWPFVEKREDLSSVAFEKTADAP